MAVNDASFDVAAGSITGLIGPNGAGKTTMFNLISGFLEPERGTIHFDGQRIDGRRPHALADSRPGPHLPDPARADPHDGAGEHDAGRHRRSQARGSARPSFGRGASPSARRELREQAQELLELIRLSRLANDYAGTLSGGQRKLLEFGRALMTRATHDPPRRADGRRGADAGHSAPGPHRRAAGDARHDDPDHRARHGSDHGHQRPRRRHGRGHSHRRGLASGDPAQRAGDRGLPGRLASGGPVSRGEQRCSA